MSPRITPENLLMITKIFTNLNACWPPKSDLTPFKSIALDILCFLCFVSTLLLLFPLWYSVYKDWDDPLVMSKSLSVSCGVALASTKIVICRIQRQRFKVLLCEMETFLRKSEGEEKRLMQIYVDKFSVLHIVMSLCCHLAATLVIIGPFMLSIPLPTDAKYPFSLNSSVTRITIFVHQSFVGFQVSSGMALDCLPASLLWFIVVRFKLLEKDFLSVQNYDDFQRCVLKHQHLLRYGRELSLAIRFLIFTTVATLTVAVVFAGIHLFSRTRRLPSPTCRAGIPHYDVTTTFYYVFYDRGFKTDSNLNITNFSDIRFTNFVFYIGEKSEPLVSKAQYMAIAWSGGAILFLTAWPAEVLIGSSIAIGDNLFSSSWIGLSPKLLKLWIVVILKSQKPVIVNIPGILPVLSLQYYTEFLSKVFSYFATVRILVS